MNIGGLSLNDTFGALYLGTVVGGCMYGVTTLQTYTYYGQCSSDSKQFRFLIFLLWLIDTAHFAVITAAVYAYLVTDVTNILAVLKPTRTILPGAVILTGFNNCVVRGVLCHRIWRLSGRNWYLAIAIATAVLVTFGGTIAYGALGMHLSSWFDLHQISWLYIFSFAWSIAADILIAVAICVLLVQRRTGFARSDSILTKLVIYSVNTGILSSLCALASLLTYITMPNNFIFRACYCIYPKMILNCLLATLNGRLGLQGKSSAQTGSSSDLSRVSDRPRRGVGHRENKHGQGLVLNIYPASGQESASSGWHACGGHVDSEAGKEDIEMGNLEGVSSRLR